VGGEVGLEELDGIEGEAVEDLAAADHLFHFRKGKGGDLEFFVGVPTHGGVHDAVFDEDKMDAVVLESGVGGGAAQQERVLAGVAGFLEEFALGSGDDVFASVNDTAGRFPGELGDAEAPLAHEEEFVARGEGKGLNPVRHFEDVKVAFPVVAGVAKVAAPDAVNATIGREGLIEGDPGGGKRGATGGAGLGIAGRGRRIGHARRF
jgi:hypothetical protein